VRFQRTIMSRSGGRDPIPEKRWSLSAGLSDGDPSKFVHLINSMSKRSTRIASMVNTSFLANWRPGHIGTPPPVSYIRERPFVIEERSQRTKGKEVGGASSHRELAPSAELTCLVSLLNILDMPLRPKLIRCVLWSSPGILIGMR
jgi:hypothetical protein